MTLSDPRRYTALPDFFVMPLSCFLNIKEPTFESERYPTASTVPFDPLSSTMVQEQQVSLLLAKQGNVELVMRPIPSPQGKQALVKVPAATS